MPNDFRSRFILKFIYLGFQESDKRQQVGTAVHVAVLYCAS